MLRFLLTSKKSKLWNKENNQEWKSTSENDKYIYAYTHTHMYIHTHIHIHSGILFIHKKEWNVICNNLGLKRIKLSEVNQTKKD